MKFFLRHILIILLLEITFFGTEVHAQVYEDDAAVWLSINLEKKLNDKFSVCLNQKNRFNNNVSQYGMARFDLGVNYKINKHIRLQAEYVIGTIKNYKNSSSWRHQFRAAIVLKQKMNRWTFLYRNMLQVRYTDYGTSESGKTPKIFDRNKITVKYEINKYVTAYASEELRWPFDQSRNKGLNRSRSIAGLEYSFSKRTMVEGYFAFQQELNAFNQTNRDFIYGIGFSHEF